MSAGIILFAHGARDPEWARPFLRIREKLAKTLPGTPVELAFLEFMKPALAEAVAAHAARGVSRITLVPLFMAQGGHLRHDVPILVSRLQEAQPGIAIRLAPAVGDIEAILDAICDWIEAEHRRDLDAGTGAGTAFA